MGCAPLESKSKNKKHTSNIKSQSNTSLYKSECQIPDSQIEEEKFELKNTNQSKFGNIIYNKTFKSQNQLLKINKLEEIIFSKNNEINGDYQNEYNQVYGRNENIKLNINYVDTVPRKSALESFNKNLKIETDGFNEDYNFYEKIDIEKPEYSKEKSLHLKKLASLLSSRQNLNKKSFIEDKNFDIKNNSFIPSLKNTLNNQQLLLDFKTIKAEILIDEEGNQQINNYLLLEYLGKGAYASVRLGYDLNEERYYAIKIVNKNKMKRTFFKPGNQDSFDPIENEKKVLRGIYHDHCVELFEILEDDQNTYFVFEYMQKGSLNSNYEKIENDQIWKYYRDLIIGLEYLHEKVNIIHFDIKCDNLLINDENVLKISDFGISKKLESGDDLIHSYKFASPFYIPPEMTLPKNEFHGRAVDIWASGIVLYFLIFKTFPFSVNNFSEISFLYKMIRTKKIEFNNNVELSGDLEDLILKLLEKDPKKRITINEIKSHPWITRNGEFPLDNIPSRMGKKNILTKSIIFKATLENGLFT